MQKKTTLEQIQEFYDMLTGGSLPEGMLMSSQPQLSGESAFSVIWFLQEHMHVFDARFERCHSCDTIFDAHESGTTVSDEDSFDDDDWYKEHGISEKAVEFHYGNSYCSEQCEISTMRSTEQTLAADPILAFEPDFICTGCDNPVEEKDVCFANGEEYCLGCFEGISMMNHEIFSR
jgi:hypothetical protein